MPLIQVPAPSLERELLRRGVGARTRESRHCGDCGRTPLTGEHIHFYDGGRIACELCRQLRRERPERSELVLGLEHGQTVRVTARAA